MHEYCFCFVLSSNEDLPRGDDFWVWVEGVSLFSGHIVRYTVSALENASNQLMCLKKHVLGKTIPTKQIASSTIHWFGGFDSVDEKQENVISFGSNPGGVWLGEGTMPFIDAVVAKSIMELYGDGYFSIVLDRLLDFIGRSKAVWGFVDLFPTNISQQGRSFGSVGYSDVPSLMLSRNAVWRARSRKGVCLSGIHWGNFLGNELLEKLGGRSFFLNEAKRELTLPNGKLYGILRELESGVFFAVCPTPEEFTSDPTVCYPLKWFAELLVDHDLI